MQSLLEMIATSRSSGIGCTISFCNNNNIPLCKTHNTLNSHLLCLDEKIRKRKDGKEGNSSFKHCSMFFDNMKFD